MQPAASPEFVEQVMLVRLIILIALNVFKALCRPLKDKVVAGSDAVLCANQTTSEGAPAYKALAAN